MTTPPFKRKKRIVIFEELEIPMPSNGSVLQEALTEVYKMVTERRANLRDHVTVSVADDGSLLFTLNISRDDTATATEPPATAPVRVSRAPIPTPPPRAPTPPPKAPTPPPADGPVAPEKVVPPFPTDPTVRVLPDLSLENCHRLVRMEPGTYYFRLSRNLDPKVIAKLRARIRSVAKTAAKAGYPETLVEMNLHRSHEALSVTTVR